MKVSDSGEMASTALFLAFASSLFNCGIQVYGLAARKNRCRKFVVALFV